MQEKVFNCRYILVTTDASFAFDRRMISKNLRTLRKKTHDFYYVTLYIIEAA